MIRPQPSFAKTIHGLTRLSFRKLVAYVSFFLLISHTGSLAQDTSWIKVHFIYGSRPKNGCKQEPKWFGGIHGGHVGIEYDTGKVIDFAPKGKFHYIERQRCPHSAYSLRSMKAFWHTFKQSDSASLKVMTILVPLDSAQSHRLDSIVKRYPENCPYDYAFLGMRCAAASYDILAEIGVLEPFSRRGTWCRIFYPKLLRKRMIHLAHKKHWMIWKKAGSDCRVWEKD
ncbi:MAG: hypothetical protein GC180_09620 [Bacteroidetes bacterium]|nr:hypothetical protein [Bacteroidota bacterium]